MKKLTCHCGKVEAEVKIPENGIDKIRFITDPEGMLYPENYLEENEKFLEGFVNRESEKIKKKLDLFK